MALYSENYKSEQKSLLSPTVDVSLSLSKVGLF